MVVGADARAQTSKTEKQPPQAPRRDPAVEILAADAAGLPPELAADALIRIAASPRVADNAWKRELLTEAFFHAYGARDGYRRSTPQAIPPDTRQGARIFAYATSLNRVSLQARAAQLMAYVDPERARELFGWIDLDLAPAVCDDVVAPAVDEYYSALTLLARTTFGDDRVAALRFFELFLWRARLPSEIPAVEQNGQARLLSDFATAIRTGRAAETSGADNLWSFGAVMAGVESAEEGTTVRVGKLISDE